MYQSVFEMDTQVMSQTGREYLLYLPKEAIEILRKFMVLSSSIGTTTYGLYQRTLTIRGGITVHTTGIQFDWFGFDQTRKTDVHST